MRQAMKGIRGGYDGAAHATASIASMYNSIEWNRFSGTISAYNAITIEQRIRAQHPVVMQGLHYWYA